MISGGEATGAKAMSATTNLSLMTMNISFGVVCQILPRTTRRWRLLLPERRDAVQRTAGK